MIEIKNLSMHFGGLKALNKINLVIKEGEFFSILGPSGCGKTTLLRILSGFQKPTSGTVVIDGRDMTNVAPEKRPTAMVFQNLALFPMMSVVKNIAFGMRMHQFRKKVIENRVAELIELVHLQGKEDHKISQLSGGQKQRVAIARALAVSPRILLLDEPLSALDYNLRQHMRGELKNMHKKLGVTFVYVTHDQSAALSMSDNVAVLKEGALEDLGTPDTLYKKPNSLFSANFIGENNIVSGSVKFVLSSQRVLVDCALGVVECEINKPTKQGNAIKILLRPETLKVSKQPQGNAIAITLKVLSLEGTHYICETTINSCTLKVLVPSQNLQNVGVFEGYYFNFSTPLYAIVQDG